MVSEISIIRQVMREAKLDIAIMEQIAQLLIKILDQLVDTRIRVGNEIPDEIVEDTGNTVNVNVNNGNDNKKITQKG
jgi:hypothetical protein